MSDEKPPPEHRPIDLDYKSPERAAVSSGWVCIGVGIALALAVAVPIVSATIDAQFVHRGDDYAGLAGLIVGIFGGAVLGLVAFVVGVVLVARKRGPRRYGLGFGLLVGSGLHLLGFGICFASTMR